VGKYPVTCTEHSKKTSTDCLLQKYRLITRKIIFIVLPYTSRVPQVRAGMRYRSIAARPALSSSAAVARRAAANADSATFSADVGSLFAYLVADYRLAWIEVDRPASEAENETDLDAVLHGDAEVLQLRVLVRDTEIVITTVIIIIKNLKVCRGQTGSDRWFEDWS